MTAPLISPESTARWYAERGRVAGEDRIPGRCECELTGEHLAAGLGCSCGFEDAA